MIDINNKTFTQLHEEVLEKRKTEKLKQIKIQKEILEKSTQEVLLKNFKERYAKWLPLLKKEGIEISAKYENESHPQSSAILTVFKKRKPYHAAPKTLEVDMSYSRSDETFIEMIYYHLINE